MTGAGAAEAAVRATGGCLCGAVRYAVRGPLRGVVLCHCAMCRRTHGHVAAYTAAQRSVFSLLESRGLRWYASSPIARRGFCGECGASLFWERVGRDTISIAAGALDGPTGLTIIEQIHTRSAGDYYAIDPSIPRRED
jgi:hypothetical protein